MIRPDADRARDKTERTIEASRLLREALDACGLSCESLAFWLGTQKTQVERAQSANHDATLPLRDVLGLPPVALRVIVEALAEQLGLAVVEVPDTEVSPASMLLAAEAQRESSEAVASLLSAMASGHITRAEGAELEREAGEAIAVLLTVRELGRAAQREGVLGVEPLRAVGGKR